VATRWRLGALRRPSASVPGGAEVVLGFDGSFSGDCTALVAVTVADRPYVRLVELWRRPRAVGVARALGRGRGRYLGRLRPLARPRGRRPLPLARSLELLDAEGIAVSEFPQSPARMGPATARFYSAAVDRLLSHDGSPALARHVANAVLKEDSRGARLAKEDKDSRRRIDVAVAAVMAHNRAAILAGDRGPSIYV
jgi:Phage Terminase